MLLSFSSERVQEKISNVLVNMAGGHILQIVHTYSMHKPKD